VISVDVNARRIVWNYRPAIMSICRDITERKRAEEQIQKSRNEALRLSNENEIVANIGRIINSTMNIEEIYKATAV
jgi:hypothetical protein